MFRELKSILWLELPSGGSGSWSRHSAADKLVKHVLPPVDSWVSSRVPSIDAYCHPSTQVPGPGSGVYLRKLSSCWAHFIRDVHKVAEVPESLLVQWIWVFRGLCFYFFLASLISNAKEYMRIGMYIKAILNSWF